MPIVRPQVEVVVVIITFVPLNKDSYVLPVIARTHGFTADVKEHYKHNPLHV